MRIALRMVFGTALAIGILFPAPALMAQAVSHNTGAQELDFAFTYNAQHSNTTGGNSFWLQGGSAEIAGTFYRGLGAVADITATHASNIESDGVDLTLITATFGPRYTWALPLRRKSSRQVRLFGEALGGFVNGINSVFPSTTGAQSEANDLAFQIGGGADLLLSRHLALRVIQAHWLSTRLPNGASNVENNLQLGAGIVFRIR